VCTAVYIIRNCVEDDEEIYLESGKAGGGAALLAAFSARTSAAMAVLQTEMQLVRGRVGD